MKYEAVIIGGGFYGLSVALFLRDHLGIRDILVIEKEAAMMERASYVNQARIHNGYHYPRSVLTGYRSAVNFPTFVEEYKEAVVNDFEKYYGISRLLSKVNAKQFKMFCEKIGVEAEEVKDRMALLFNPSLVEKVFKVKEYAFNSRILRELILERISRLNGITILNNEEVASVAQQENSIVVQTNKDMYVADKVFNCTYSQINNLHRESHLSLIQIKQEITEMCLVQLPPELSDFTITMMDGPFFSIMPFPSRGLHTLSHVRYTPHETWLDDEDTPRHKRDAHGYFSSYKLNSNYKKMYADVIRYIPALKDMEYVESISEVKTVLVKSEGDDSRPILFKPNFGISNYTCIMGGKLDNIYDVYQDLKILYGKN